MAALWCLKSCEDNSLLTTFEDHSLLKSYNLGPIGHRPVIVKRALIGSKGGCKLSTIFLSCKVFHDWSIIKLGNILYLLDGSIFAVLFGTTSHCFC